MRLLLQYGASMERDGYGMTPLLSASVTGHTNIVDYLTSHQQVWFADDLSDELGYILVRGLEEYVQRQQFQLHRITQLLKFSTHTLNSYSTDEPQGAH